MKQRLRRLKQKTIGPWNPSVCLKHRTWIEILFTMRTNMSEEKKKTETDGPSVGGCSNIGIHHVGLYAKDPSVTAEFYRDVMGMQIVGGSSADAPIGPALSSAAARRKRVTKSHFSRTRRSGTLPSRWPHSQSCDLSTSVFVLESYRLKWWRTMEPRSPSILMTRTET